MEPHLLNALQVIKKLNSSIEHGLSTEQVNELRLKYGSNKLIPKKVSSLKRLFSNELKQSKIFIIALLNVSLCLLGCAPYAVLNSCIILFQIFLNSIFIQKALKKSLQTEQSIQSTSKVFRDAQEQTIYVRDLVVGDILLLDQGQIIAVEARVIEAQSLKVSELWSVNTIVEKFADIVEDETPISQRNNMLFKGSKIISGFGKAVVVAIGEQALSFPEMDTVKKHSIVLPFTQKIKHVSSIIFCVLIGLALYSLFFNLILKQPIEMGMWVLICWALVFIPRGVYSLWQLILSLSINKALNLSFFVQNQHALEKLNKLSVLIFDHIEIHDDNKILIKKLRGKGIKVILMSARQIDDILSYAMESDLYTLDDRILNSDDYAHIADEELMRLLDTTTVYAGVNVQYKIKIMSLFKKLGKNVCFISNENKDLQALEAADINFAPEITTDMIKEKADIILLNLSLSCVLNAIEYSSLIKKRLTMLLISVSCAIAALIISLSV